LASGEIIYSNDLINDSKDIAKLLINLDGWIKDRNDINYLSEIEVKNIVNWDMEKFRQGINK
jgi:hypothetical protein